MSPKQEKLIELGTLVAGLIHEINNPVVAANRTVNQLHDVVLKLLFLTLQLNQQMTQTQLKHIFELHQELLECVSTNTEIDALTYSDHEEEITVWLETHNVLNGWKLAPTFVEAGLDTKWLSSVEKLFSVDSLSYVLN